MINELYNTLIALNTNFKDLFKRQKLKTPSKQTFNEILTQLLLLYDDNNASSLSLSDEEIIQLFRDLGMLVLPQATPTWFAKMYSRL